MFDLFNFSTRLDKNVIEFKHFTVCFVFKTQVLYEPVVNIF